MATKVKDGGDTTPVDSMDMPIELHEEPVTFELTDKDLPKSARGNRGSKYSTMLAEFNGQEKSIKYVQFSGRKPASVYVGLKKAITTEGLQEKVSVVSRGTENGIELWLVRK